MKRTVPELGLTPKEAAEALHVGVSSIKRWFADGKLPGVRLGGRIIISRQGVEAMLQGHEAPAVQMPARAPLKPTGSSRFHPVR